MSYFLTYCIQNCISINFIHVMEQNVIFYVLLLKIHHANRKFSYYFLQIKKLGYLQGRIAADILSICLLPIMVFYILCRWLFSKA